METDATVCEIDAHFRHNYLNHKTMRRHQKYNLKLLKFAIDAQKSEDCRSRILTIKNGSNPVFEPNILAGVEGLEPSRTVLETGMLPLHHTPVLNFKDWWTVRDSNPGPTGYEPVALPTELTVHIPLKRLPPRYRDGNTVLLAPPVGFEPTTLRLTAACSTC